MEIPWEVCASERPCRDRSASWRPTDRNPDSEEPEIRNAGKGFVGIDGESEYHQGCILDASGAVPKERSFPQGGTGRAQMADGLRTVTQTEPDAIGVALEVPHGPGVESRMERGRVLPAIPPKPRDRFRDRGSPAGAKDDRREARVRAGALRTDGPAFRRIDPISPAVIRLREASRRARDRTHPRTRLVHRIRPQLWRYDPQLLELESDLSRAWFRELRELVPTPDRARRLRASTVTRLLRRHRVRRLPADTVRKTLRTPALRGADGTPEAAVGPLRMRFAPLGLVTGPRTEVQPEIDRPTAEERQPEAAPESASGPAGPRDAEILRSRPGVGRIVRATLLAEAPEARRRRDDPALRCRSGVAPVPRRSGTSRIGVRRRAAPHRLQDAVYPWARVALPQDPVRRAQYPALRLRGHRHARALRSVADRRLAGVGAMRETQSLFLKSVILCLGTRTWDMNRAFSRTK